MLRYLLASNLKPGGRPGDLGSDRSVAPEFPLQVYRMDYGGADSTAESSFDTLEQALAEPVREGGLTWLHFQGSLPPSGLRAVREAFNLHPLAVEDVLNHGQRPKLEIFDDQLFAVLALPRRTDGVLTFEQISVFVGTGYVLSFHAGDRDIFAPIRKRVHDAKGRIALAEADYLGYALVDVVVDYAFPVLETYADQLETIEDDIFAGSLNDPITAIYGCRRDLIAMRKVLWQQTGMVDEWVRLEHPLLSDDNRPYYRDAQDHARRVSDLLDGYRDTTASLLDTHLSLSSARMNDVMKMLTLIATIFMPLSFLAGIYGMNFDTKSPYNMPELSFPYAYPILLGVMVLLVIGMLIYFRRRKWI